MAYEFLLYHKGGRAPHPNIQVYYDEGCDEIVEVLKSQTFTDKLVLYENGCYTLYFGEEFKKAIGFTHLGNL